MTKSRNQTAALQKSIDACARRGGGRVCVPPGEHHVKTLHLRDNVELCLERGARLVSLLKPPAANRAVTADKDLFLIGGDNLHNAAICGDGVIDGNGHAFWEVDASLDDDPLFGRQYKSIPGRPKGMLHFRNCSHLSIRGVTLVNPPTYTVWLLGCDVVDLDRIKIRTDRRGPNTDGLDIDCCSNVGVSNCDIVAGDDAIALKSSRSELGTRKACENITITNCRLSSRYSGIRLGWEGDNAIRNCVFTGNVIHDSLIGLSMLVVIDERPFKKLDVRHGSPIGDILFSDMIVDARMTFQIQHGKVTAGRMTGCIDRVRVRNIVATSKIGSYIGAFRGNPIRNLEISGLDMRVTGDALAEGLVRNAAWQPPAADRFNPPGCAQLPWPLVFNHVAGLSLQDCRFAFDRPRGWRKRPKLFNVAPARA